MQEFIKIDATTLAETDKAKIKNFKDLDAVCQAICDGELQAGDLFTTICRVESIQDDIALEVYRLKSYVPEGTTASNSLVNIEQLEGITDTKIDDVIMNGSTLTHTVDPDTKKVSVDLGNILDSTTFTNFVSNTYIPFTTDTNTELGCRVICCDYTNAISNINSNKVSCSDYQSCCNSWNSSISSINSTLSSHASSISSNSSSISSLSSNKVSCSDYQSCCNYWNGEINTLWNCIRNLENSRYSNNNFSLSGNTLTITSC